MAALGSMVIANLPAFVKGVVEAQRLQLRFMRSELKRGAQRIRKTFIREQLQGPPGIKAGQLAKGKNVFTFVKGDDPRTLSAKIGISRILHVHEKGLTITPQKSDRLYLSKKTGVAREGTIFATAERVVIPSRLRFRQLVVRESPAVLKKVAEAGMRGTEVAMTKALKQQIGL